MESFATSCCLLWIPENAGTRNVSTEALFDALCYVSIPMNLYCL